MPEIEGRASWLNKDKRSVDATDFSIREEERKLTQQAKLQGETKKNSDSLPNQWVQVSRVCCKR